MKSKNIAFENSLACLQHPLTLLSIAILLLNDHVLKVVSPSWWTGKLSDFAGLFFFPFIVAAGLSLALSKFNLLRQRIGQIAFGLVVIWFVLLKTVPLANLMTAQFASLFIGAPIRLILDWTDLMALVSMWPGWIIWTKLKFSVSKRFSHVVLTVGILASIASSPTRPFESVTVVEFRNNAVYAIEVKAKGFQDYPTAWSKDGGITWNHYGSALGDLSKKINEKALPALACSNTKPGQCYQVTEKGNLEFSMDNGQTWETMTDVIESYSIVRAHDLVIFSWNEKEYLIVAVGEKGILRRELPNGKWRLIGVFDADK